MCVCVGGCVCVNLRRVHGVGEDGADRSVSWRQTGIFSGMLVFLCHLGGTWYGQYETLERLLSRSLSLSHRHAHMQEHVQHIRDRIAARCSTITHEYGQSGKANPSFFLQASRPFFKPH